MLAGGIFLPLNTAYTSEEISYFLSDATPAFLICDPTKLNALEPLAEKSGVIKTFYFRPSGKWFTNECS